MTGETEPGRPPLRSPGDRFSWVMGVCWLVFLGFPVSAALQVDAPPVVRALLVLDIVAFAGLYTAGFVLWSVWANRAADLRLSRLLLAALIVLAAASAPALGGEALTMVTFLIAFGMATLPVREGRTLAAGWIALTVAVVMFGGDSGGWIIVVINIGVALLTGFIRWLEENEDAHQSVRRELDVLAERERVARDVHDVLGHSLTVVTVKAELAERLVDLDPAAAKQELAQIRSLSREALAEIRATVSGLRVARLGDELEAARAALAGADITADLPDSDTAVAATDPRYRIVLAWVLREAVTNVVRHSHATLCRVRLTATSLTVTDDGTGCAGAAESNGLRGIRERVGAAGGSVRFAPGPDGRGTTLEVHW
ncbi:sensor histidine kinase [Nocardioides insulae]|uniref:sensor histidine kinase n=1 Tax=Nocardioides insulae TaxID=394734 RepID=UPI0003F58387|nr:sensor histidine kinase [Nocardioides insulae]